MIDFDAVFALTMIGSLVLLIEGPLQWVITDYGRHLMFEARDALFDMAREGRFEGGFENEPYRILRGQMEKQIRFAHRLTLLRVIVLLIAVSRRGQHIRSVSDQALTRIPSPEVRAEAKALVDKANQAALVMAAFKSPLVTIPLLVMSGIAHWRKSARYGPAWGARKIGEVVSLEPELT